MWSRNEKWITGHFSDWDQYVFVTWSKEVVTILQWGHNRKGTNIMCGDIGNSMYLYYRAWYFGNKKWIRC